MNKLDQTQINAIHALGFEAGKVDSSSDELKGKGIAMVRSLVGYDQETVKLHFQVAYMAGYMARKGRPTEKLLEEALMMREAANAMAKTVKAGEPQRSLEWELAYGASRSWWKRVLKAAQVDTTEERGGARERPEAKAEAAETSVDAADVKIKEAKKPSVPKVTDKAEAKKWIAETLAIFDAFATVNQAFVEADVSIAITEMRERILKLLTQ